MYGSSSFTGNDYSDEYYLNCKFEIYCFSPDDCEITFNKDTTMVSHDDEQYDTEDSEEYSEDDEEEEVQMKPIFIPKVLLHY